MLMPDENTYIHQCPTQVLALMGLIAMCTFSAPLLLRIETDLSFKRRKDSYEELSTEDDGDDYDDSTIERDDCYKAKHPLVNEAEEEIMKRMALGFESVGTEASIENGQSGPKIEGGLVETQGGSAEGQEVEEDVSDSGEMENANMCP